MYWIVIKFLKLMLHSIQCLQCFSTKCTMTWPLTLKNNRPLPRNMLEDPVRYGSICILPTRLRQTDKRIKRQQVTYYRLEFLLQFTGSDKTNKWRVGLSLQETSKNPASLLKWYLSAVLWYPLLCNTSLLIHHSDVLTALVKLGLSFPSRR
jgi:hypothetical protein